MGAANGGGAAIGAGGAVGAGAAGGADAPPGAGVVPGRGAVFGVGAGPGAVAEAAPPTVMPVCANAVQGRDNADVSAHAANKEARNAEQSFMASL